MPDGICKAATNSKGQHFKNVSHVKQLWNIHTRYIRFDVQSAVLDFTGENLKQMNH